MFIFFINNFSFHFNLQPKLQNVYYLNCHSSIIGTSRYILRINETRENVERVKNVFVSFSKTASDLYPKHEIQPKLLGIKKKIDLIHDKLECKFFIQLILYFVIIFF